MSSTRAGRRVSTACQRCRRRKIRCSGSCPCDNCTRRNTECQFDDEGRRVVVSQKYLKRLQQAASSTEAQVGADSGSVDGDARSASDVPDANEELQWEQNEHTVAETRPSPLRAPASNQLESSPANPSNPLAATSSSYVADGEGWLRWLGESSTWSFSHKTLMAARDSLGGQDVPLPEIPLNEESRAYSLTWGSAGFDDPDNFSNLPCKDHATYLLNGVMFHIGPLYHLYDQASFMDHLHEFYTSPIEVGRRRKIWYCQFLTLLALGKAISVQPARNATLLPGSDLFLRAMNMLPNPSYLISDCLSSVETLCSIALYLQCADQRNSAYIYIGQALRIATTFGLHRDRPTNDWSLQATERCQRAWWTVYVLDRTFSSSMGVPTSIQDQDITTPLPSRDGPRDSMALFIHVKLSNLITDVINKVYGAEGRLGSTFLPCVHKVLEGIASIASDLNGCFPLSHDQPDCGISRLAAHLHLFYHQTVLLTMYPLLLHLFQAKLQTKSNDISPLREFSETTAALLRTCGESCKKMVGILFLLQQQNILGGALPFDLERTFSSGFVLVMLSFILSEDTEYRGLHQQTYQLLEDFINRGCRPARFRKGEIEQLHDMIELWKARCRGENSNNPVLENERAVNSELNHQWGEASMFPHLEPGAGTFFELSPGQILSLAEMVDAQEVNLNDEVNLVDDWMWHDTTERNGS